MGNNQPPDPTQRKQQVSGLFDRAANTFDHVGPRFFSHFGRRLVELAHIPIGAHVLDVATGRGAALFPLQRFKSDVFKKVQTIRQPDGIHQLIPVLFALATKET